MPPRLREAGGDAREARDDGLLTGGPCCLLGRSSGRDERPGGAPVGMGSLLGALSTVHVVSVEGTRLAFLFAFKVCDLALCSFYFRYFTDTRESPQHGRNGGIFFKRLTSYLFHFEV